MTLMAASPCTALRRTPPGISNGLHIPKRGSLYYNSITEARSHAVI